MDNLIWIAIVLFIIWIVASFTKVVAGALLNLLWIIALILLVIWAIRKIF